MSESYLPGIAGRRPRFGLRQKGSGQNLQEIYQLETEENPKSVLAQFSYSGE